LFAADRPLSSLELSEVVRAVEDIEIPAESVTALLEEMRARFAEDSRGFELAAVAGCWEFRTRAAYADYVHVLYRRKPQRLSRAALEVLAIVAYRQPVTRPEIDDIRGVDSSNTLRQLLERNLVRILGKADDVGRPLIYGTSAEFLAFFGMQTLAELPTLKEFFELTEEHVIKLQTLEATLQAAQPGAEPPPQNLEIPLTGASTSPRDTQEPTSSSTDAALPGDAPASPNPPDPLDG
jgi:segregation and condensation protein B